MRIMVLFDLPVLTEKQRRDYREFRKYLLKAGFFMMQESVYCKLVQNAGVADVVQESIRKNKPGEGVKQIVSVILPGNIQSLRVDRIATAVIRKEVQNKML